MRSSAQKALTLLQQSGAQFASVSKCNSCHHQSLPQMAFEIARTRGFDIDEAVEQQQIDDRDRPVQNRRCRGAAEPRPHSRPAHRVSYALIGFAAAGHPRDEVTDAMAQIISAWQDDTGRFHTLPPIRPPLESSDVTATALSLRAIQLYGSPQDDRVARAVEWLRAVKPHTTEDHAMQLLGLAWGHARPHDIRKSTASLLALQRQDGGWGQLPALETDAYATGQALVALQTAGLAVSGPQYQRGLGFCCGRSFPTDHGSSVLVRSRCNCRRTADSPTACTSGSRQPARVGRRWPCCWGCRRSSSNQE